MKVDSHGAFSFFLMKSVRFLEKVIVSPKKADVFGQLEHTHGDIPHAGLVTVPTSGLSLSPHTPAWLWLVVHTDQSVQRGPGGPATASWAAQSEPFQELNARSCVVFSPFIGWLGCGNNVR